MFHGKTGWCWPSPALEPNMLLQYPKGQQSFTNAVGFQNITMTSGATHRLEKSLKVADRFYEFISVIDKYTHETHIRAILWPDPL